MPDIVLRDRNGNHLNFYGAEYLDAVFPDGTEIPYAAYDPETLTPENLASGVTVGDVVGTMSAPILLEDLPIELDFSGGNQSVAAPDGYAVKNAIIQQPATLVPGNIAEGVDIAGVIGTLAAGGGAVITSGTFSGTGGTKTLTHNLGVIPDVFVLFITGGTYTSGMTASATITALYGLSQKMKEKTGLTWASRAVLPRNTTGVSLDGSTVGIDEDASTRLLSKVTENSITIGSSYVKLASSSATYSWFAIGGLT